MEEDMPEYKYMTCSVEIPINNERLTKETKSTIFKAVCLGRGSACSASCTVTFNVSLKHTPNLIYETDDLYY
jgi:hypothetical protein